MTIINCVVQEKAAYLLTDAAWTGPDGTLLRIESKVITGVHWPWAMGITGTVNRMELTEAINVAPPRNAVQLVERLPEIVATAVSIAERRSETPHSLAVTAIMWAKKQHQVLACVCASDRTAFQDLVEPLTAFPIGFSFPGPKTPEQLLGRPANFGSSKSFDMARDGLVMMEAQRANCWCMGTLGPDEVPAFRIGGEAQLTTVTRRGCRTVTLRTWPDEVGKLIAPEAPALAA